MLLRGPFGVAARKRRSYVADCRANRITADSSFPRGVPWLSARPCLSRTQSQLAIGEGEVLAATKYSAISTREIETLSDMERIENLQREVWGLQELEVLPAEHLLVNKEIGGLLLGAYDGDALIGFVVGLVGLRDGEIILHSDMTAVRSGYRDHNLGYRLKLAQREWALAKNIQRVTWTFDPLQSRNAFLNFHKLGAEAEVYHVDFYGETSSFLHQLGTDRLWVNWRLESARVRKRLNAVTANTSPPLNYAPETALVHCDAQQVPHRNGDAAGTVTFIEIPGDINTLQQSDRSLAIRWRAVTREAFTTAMATGCRVADFHRVSRGDQLIGVYELRTGPASD